MKKIIFCLFAIGVTLFSCKKDNNVAQQQSDAKTYPVKFNLGFTQSTGPFVTNAIAKKTADVNTDTLEQLASRIYYQVYDSNNVKVRDIHQDSTSANFGVISDNLKVGKYRVVIIAGQDNSTLQYDFDFFGDLFYYVSDPTDDYSFELPWKDTFAKSFYIVVTPDGVTSNINLPRAVAQVEVNIEDAMPANATKLTVTDKNLYGFTIPELKWTGFYSQVDNGQTTVSQSITVTPGAINTKLYFLLIEPTANLTISCYAGTTLLSTKSVTCQTILGETTLVTGQLFGTSNTGNGFSVNINPVWNPPVNKSF